MTKANAGRKTKRKLPLTWVEEKGFEVTPAPRRPRPLRFPSHRILLTAPEPGRPAGFPRPARTNS